MFSATTKEEFEEVRAAEVQPTTSYTFLQPPVDDGILINTAAGYQPMEYLRGNTLTADSEGNEVVDAGNENKVSFTSSGIFGHCEHTTPALFMNNSNESTCVVAYKPVSADTCS